MREVVHILTCDKCGFSESKVLFQNGIGALHLPDISIAWKVESERRQIGLYKEKHYCPSCWTKESPSV